MQESNLYESQSLEIPPMQAKVRRINQLYLSSVGGFGKGSCSDQGFQVVIPFEVLLQSTVSFGTVLYIYIPYMSTIQNIYKSI